MPSIFDMFDSKEIKAYYDAVKANEPTASVVTGKFPKVRSAGLKLSWIKGHSQVPVALQPSAFDTKAQVRDRIGIERLETEMPFFRESMKIDEKERQDLGTLMAASPDLAKPVITKIFDDAKNLIDGADVQARRMACNILTTGAINVATKAESGRVASYAYNYDPNGTWAASNAKTLAAGAKWTVANKANSAPITDLLAVKSAMRKKGVLIREVIMNYDTYIGMVASDSIVKALNPNGATSMILTENDSQAYIEMKTGMKISIEDGTFIDEEGAEQFYFPTGYVACIPDGALGNTHFGTTPEEFDLRMQYSTASVAIVGGGIAVTTYVKPHPVNNITLVSAIVLPSFEGMDKAYTLKVQ